VDRSPSNSRDRSSRARGGAFLPHGRALRSGWSGTYRKLAFEPLEDRRVLATFTVTNLGDAVVTGPGSAPGTLRQAIYDANNSAGADLIQFAAGLSGDVDLSVADDASVGLSALLVTSQITIQGNANGITIRRDAAAPEMRLVLVAAGGDLSLDTIMLAGGLARGANGGTGQNGGTAFGGAVYNQGTLQIIASTFYGNAAIGGNAGQGGIAGAGLGGAVYNDGSTLSIRNSTLSGNYVSSGTGTSFAPSFGGAVYSENGTLDVYNSTITNNAALSGRDFYIKGVGAGQTAVAQIYSSIIAQADVQVTAKDFLATFEDGGQVDVSGANNLIRSHNNYGSIIISSDDPLLGTLTNNGGPTLTHALLTDSPAIGLGTNLLNLSNDQRGSSYARVVGGTTDIGAFEVQTVAAPALPGDYNGNHFVDAADYVVWRKTMGAEVPQYSGADGNGSSIIDAADYDVWHGNFGATSPAAAAAFSSMANAASVDHAAPSVTDPISGRLGASTSLLSDFAVVEPFAGQSNSIAARTEMARESSIRDEQTAPFINLAARDEALLAIVGEQFSGPHSYGSAAALKNDLSAPQAESGARLSTDDALIQALLQTASFGAASIGTA
jgi:hypothetical protein